MESGARPTISVESFPLAARYRCSAGFASPISNSAAIARDRTRAASSGCSGWYHRETVNTPSDVRREMNRFQPFTVYKGFAEIVYAPAVVPAQLSIRLI